MKSVIRIYLFNFFLNFCSWIQARSQDLEKGGGYFERVRSVQTTSTRIFIALESVSHGLHENWDEFSRKPRKFKGFFHPKSVGLQKKSKVFTEFETEFSAQLENPNVWGGLFSYGGGGYFQFFTKNQPQNHQKGAILHTSQANGGLEPPRPPWLRYWLNYT